MLTAGVENSVLLVSDYGGPFGFDLQSFIQPWCWAGISGELHLTGLTLCPRSAVNKKSARGSVMYGSS